eukprot:c23850_g1_i1 orf=571-1137(+)
MGNHLTCMPCTSEMPTVKVFYPEDGKMIEFQMSITVAELMLEFPAHFVCHSRALHNGQRIAPLPADQELILDQVYILVPMTKLYTRFHAADRTLFSAAFNNSRIGIQPKHFQSKVTPLRVDSQGYARDIKSKAKPDQTNHPFPVERAQTFEFGRVGELSMGASHSSIQRSRSWMPQLETISESSLLKI